VAHHGLASNTCSSSSNACAIVHDGPILLLWLPLLLLLLLM